MAAPFSLRRILVVVDDSAECAVALRSVTRMAERSRAAVEALYIEDTTVLHLASLTVVRHVYRHGGPAAPLDVTTIESIYRSQRLGAQRAVSGLTDASGTPCELRVMRGSVSEAILRAAGAADLVVLTLPSCNFQRLAGVAEKLGGTGPQALLLLRSTVEPSGLVAIADHSPEKDDRLLAVASGIGRLLGARVRLFSSRADELRDLATDVDTRGAAEIVPERLDAFHADSELWPTTVVACNVEGMFDRLAPYASMLDARRCPLLISF